MRVKNFERSMISIPKCKKLNSELILVLDFGFGPHPGPRSNISFLWGEMSEYGSNSKNGVLHDYF